jgi:hypothetical protein
MDQSERPQPLKSEDPARRAALALWLAGALIMAAAMGLGMYSEDRLQSSPLGAAAPRISALGRAAPFLFAFGFPLGLVLAALAARVPLSGGPAGRWGPVAGAALLVAAPVLVPVLAGRGPSRLFFGTGGTLIALCASVAFLYLGRLRRTLAAPARGAIDLLVWGLCCFAVAAWNLCGVAAMPSHLLDPERVLALGTLPFALGQTKAVMALLATGWVLILLAARRAARTDCAGLAKDRRRGGD